MSIDGALHLEARRGVSAITMLLLRQTGARGLLAGPRLRRIVGLYLQRVEVGMWRGKQTPGRAPYHRTKAQVPLWANRSHGHAPRNDPAPENGSSLTLPYPTAYPGFWEWSKMRRTLDDPGIFLHNPLDPS
jgi:hypothetical protein